MVINQINIVVFVIKIFIMFTTMGKGDVKIPEREIRKRLLSQWHKIIINE